MQHLPPWQRFDPLATAPLLIGHRGARAHAPENTLAGIRQAKAEGCRWVELDVKLSRDGVPILIHDDDLERTTTGSGLVGMQDYADLRQWDAGAGERIPHLQEALELIWSLDLRLNLEIKPCPGRAEETARMALECAGALWPADQPPPVISSFEDVALATARRICPDWPVAVLLNREEEQSDWQARLVRHQAMALHLSDKLLTAESLPRYQEAVGDLPLLVFTVNDPARADWLFRHGIAGIFTDSPAQMRAGLEQNQAGA